ncbi:MAG: GIY-YIG nuclease family protein [Dehalococcoidia bacterium]
MWARTELLSEPSSIPRAQGIYGWYFDEPPHPACTNVGTVVNGWSLLYVGIAPGRVGSTSNLRTRLRSHLKGNARGSTLRLTLGCLLAERLGLRPVARSGGLHFGSGEDAISAWLGSHARVSWVELDNPWTVEADVVKRIGAPLNRQHNETHEFYPILGTLRRAMKDSLRT